MTTTAIRTKDIEELHFEHELWNSEIKFFTDELKIFQKELERLNTIDRGLDFRKRIEHFQNQFIIQKEQLDILNNATNMHEAWLAEYAEEHDSTIEMDKFADHKIMRDKMDLFRKIYSNLKSDFYDLMEKWR